MERTLFYTIICLLLAFTSCKSNIRDEEQKGEAIYLSMPESDVAGSINLLIFNNEDVLTKEIDYSSSSELSDDLLDLAAGDYTIVATSKTQDIFSTKEKTGETKLQDLCMILNDPSSSPEEAFYGLKKIHVESESFNTVEIPMNRIFSEIHLTLKDLSDEITKVSAEVTNAATGFYPGTGILTSDNTDVLLGEVKVENGTADIPVRRLMPVITSVLTKSDDSSDITTGTFISFKFYKEDGSEFTSHAQMPVIESGGIYSHEFDFNDLIPEVILDLLNIADWGENEPVYGEILNPAE